MRKKANLAFQLWVGKKELTLKISDFRSPSPLLTLFRSYKPLPISKKKSPVRCTCLLPYSHLPTHIRSLFAGLDKLGIR